MTDSKQKTKLTRIDGRYFSQQVQGLFNLDKGLLYTTKEFFLRPGKSTQEFLYENREKHVKPIVFLIFTSVLFSLVSYFLEISYSYFNVNAIESLKGKVSTGAIGEWLNNNVGYANLIIGVFIAFWIKLFAQNYNVFEIIVMMCFVLGVGTLIMTLSFIVGAITDSGLISVGIMLIFFLYLIWAIGQFFGIGSLISYLKALFVIVLGLFSYLAVSIVLGYFWYLIQN